MLSFSTVSKKSDIAFIYSQLAEQQEQIRELTALIGQITNILERIA